MLETTTTPIQVLPHLRIRNLSVWYGKSQALHSIDSDIPVHGITATIGP